MTWIKRISFSKVLIVIGVLVLVYASGIIKPVTLSKSATHENDYLRLCVNSTSMLRSTESCYEPSEATKHRFTDCFLKARAGRLLPECWNRGTGQ